MRVGGPLVGELAGCRKLKHRKACLRVVFKESSRGIEIIDIIAIRKQEDSKVYETAKRRI